MRGARRAISATGAPSATPIATAQTAFARLWASSNASVEGRLAVGGDDRRPQPAAGALDLAREDLTPGAEGDRLQPLGEVRLERLGVGGEHGPAVARRARR